MMRNVWMLSLVIFVLVSGCDSGLTEGPQDQGTGQPVAFKKVRPSLGDQASEFKLIDLEGNWQALSNFKGKVVLLNFWATWCGPCRVEMPSMEILYKDLKSEGFEILAISSDPQGSIVTRPFVESQGFTFPILHDADYRVSGTYGIRTLPMSYLIDRRGILRHRVFGARDWNSEQARELIKELLETS